jgi:hypothetical protein
LLLPQHHDVRPSDVRRTQASNRIRRLRRWWPLRRLAARWAKSIS